MLPTLPSPSFLGLSSKSFSEGADTLEPWITCRGPRSRLAFHGFQGDTRGNFQGSFFYA